MLNKVLIPTVALVFATLITVSVSWAMTEEQRAEICDIGIIQGMERLNGKPHDRAECIQNPDAYLDKIMRENQAISTGIVKKKQAVQSAPVKISIDAQLACKTAIIKQALFPSSADFSFWGSKKWRAPEGKTIMKGDVSLMLSARPLPATESQLACFESTFLLRGGHLWDSHHLSKE